MCNPAAGDRTLSLGDRLISPGLRTEHRSISAAGQELFVAAVFDEAPFSITHAADVGAQDSPVPFRQPRDDVQQLGLLYRPREALFRCGTAVCRARMPWRGVRRYFTSV
jgi:hypothetical protein